MAIRLPVVETPNAASANAAQNPVGDRQCLGRYAFVSLGCPKNTVDSERMLGQLHRQGYDLVANPEEAEFVVINTCGFIDRARQESMEAIDQMLQLKRDGKIRGVIVSGCLAEREREALLEARPEIDSLVGVFSRDDVTLMAARVMDGLDEQRTVFRPAPIRALDDTHRLRITPPHFAYLKISEGCDRLCTFCAIPKMRGKHASKPLENIIDEATELARSGVRELIVVAQDTTYYGRDLYGENRLSQLLERLSAIDDIQWIRLMYFYPMYIDDRLLDVMADSPKILPYIDMPLQHINGEMLRRMSRRVSPEATRELITKMRERIDDLVIRTTFITGFPGETQEHVDELAEFLQQSKFERLGVFTYSLEPDTPAAKLPGHVDEQVKLARQQQLMQVQQQVAFAWAKRQVGRAVEVIVDKELDKSKNVWLARSPADAPDVDALVYLTGSPRTPLYAGALVPCEIVGHQQYDLIAAAIGQPR
ncbi:MAG: 30S ribosomal protein S12 methylthiotransferase RimO [Pirellulaceae bacterium]|nr:30S ribosomal protein S12 methylthiotransferase RimO [Pirellulaceae bacterium]